MHVVKLVYLVRRRAGTSHDQLVRQWREVHTAQVAEALRPDRYVVTLFRPRGGDGAGEHDWDGMAALWFQDEARGLAIANREIAGAPGDDFAAMTDVVRLRCEEHVFFDRPAEAADEPLKLTFLVVARPGAAHADVVRHWVDVHGPAVAAPMAEVAGARRYVASPALAPGGGYTGVTELSYASRQASAAHAAALVDDGFGRLADNGIYLVAEDELVIR